MSQLLTNRRMTMSTRNGASFKKEWLSPSNRQLKSQRKHILEVSNIKEVYDRQFEVDIVAEIVDTYGRTGPNAYYFQGLTLNWVCSLEPFSALKESHSRELHAAAYHGKTTDKELARVGTKVCLHCSKSNRDQVTFSMSVPFDIDVNDTPLQGDFLPTAAAAAGAAGGGSGDEGDDEGDGDDGEDDGEGDGSNRKFTVQQLIRVYKDPKYGRFALTKYANYFLPKTFINGQHNRQQLYWGRMNKARKLAEKKVKSGQLKDEDMLPVQSGVHCQEHGDWQDGVAYVTKEQFPLLEKSPKFYVPEKISLREVFLNRKIIVRCATPTRALVYTVLADHLCSPLLEPFYTAQAKIGEAIFADEATACLNFSLASLTERMLQRGQWNGRGDCRVSKADCCSDLAYLQCHQMLGGVLCSVDPVNSDYYATALIESPEVVFGLKVAYFIFSDFITSVTYEYAMSVKCSHYGTLEECTHFLSLAIILSKEEKNGKDVIS
ncbi:hypothetical protein TYRP_017306 [Tyrophagus putrescentiae]|nr:hypothetical protein TYRP_017306 [Tyrophagus putrescentiae]